ncbi:thermonuclease family protein [Ramlibacter pallidus]|uniref:Thermonuclease family protein n=1 Tax=Ramlibacter pallidus TaxID=2780087 RepID=A0ABR9RZX7_9BURK|nr:thermonuclease family protein [Ramlibacter pallidus]MBE7366816.1 thermonuclease family protein [Ramlibacter pallidus]
MRGWILAACIVAAPALQAATFHGLVTHVTDGDTIWVRPNGGGAPVELRLVDIDAPEGCQPHGAEAKRALRERLLREPVRVQTQGTDTFDRQLARVQHRRQDIGAWMVRNGHAWSSSFQGKAGPHARLERLARQERKGLWSVPGALEPRSFRKRFGRCQ